MPRERTQPPDGAERLRIVDACSRRMLEGLTWAEVANEIGVDPATLRGWRGSDWWEDLESEAIGSYCSEALDEARAVMLARVKDGDLQAIIWTLERLDPWRFGNAPEPITIRIGRLESPSAKG